MDLKIDSGTAYWSVRGADTWNPFKSVVDLGTGTSFNVTKYPGYTKFTVDNFIVGAVSVYAVTGNVGYVNFSSTVSKSYNQSTGILTISGTVATYNVGNQNSYATVETKAYLII